MATFLKPKFVTVKTNIDHFVGNRLDEFLNFFSIVENSFTPQTLQLKFYVAKYRPANNFEKKRLDPLREGSGTNLLRK